MNSEMMAKLRGLIEEAATGTCNMTAEGKSCPVHGMEECAGYMEEKEELDEAFDANATLKRVRGAAKKVELSNDANAATEFARDIDGDLTNLFQWYDWQQQRENKEKIRSLIKANKAAEQTPDLKHANTVAEVLLDIMRSTGIVGEDIKPAGISDELAAKKIAAKIAGTPGLNIPKIKQYVTKYLSMVGKAPTDVDHLAALVSTELENKGVMESNTKPDFLDIDKDGNKKESMKDAAKDAKAGKKSTGKKGEMSAKQAKYFGKKKAVAESKATLKDILANPSLAVGTEHEGLFDLMREFGVISPAGKLAPGKTASTVKFPEFPAKNRATPDTQRLANAPQDILSKRGTGSIAQHPDEYKYMMTKNSPDAKRMKNLYRAGGPKSALPEDEASSQQPAPQPGSLRHYLDNPDADPTGTEHEDLLNLMHKYGYHDKKTSDVDENVHITVDGAEAQDMINRLMALAGQEGMPTVDNHADTCDGCGHADGECTCDQMTPASFGPDGLSMEENIDHDFGHTAHSDMGEPVDPDTYMYKAPVGNQRMVKGTLGDNPLIKEDADALGAKLKKDYKRYVAEAELARSNAGDASPLTADNCKQFDKHPFTGETPVTDGSRSPLSTIKRQKVNK